MTRSLLMVCVVVLSVTTTAWLGLQQDWVQEKYASYTLYFTNKDKINKEAYVPIIDKGIEAVYTFCTDSFRETFAIYIHPNRYSLDSTWRKDWNMPGFNSECWMVASGIATKLDMISPKEWDTEACDHIYTEKLKTQQLITHELFHVYHAQQNTSPDFSDATGIDWFVEGFATYASGQCDEKRINEVKNAIAKNEVPPSLDKFWTGKIRYGLSGSTAMFIDKKYGRTKLKELLQLNNTKAIFTSLNTTENSFIAEWKEFMKKN